MRIGSRLMGSAYKGGLQDLGIWKTVPNNQSTSGVLSSLYGEAHHGDKVLVRFLQKILVVVSLVESRRISPPDEIREILSSQSTELREFMLLTYFALRKFTMKHDIQKLVTTLSPPQIFHVGRKLIRLLAFLEQEPSQHMPLMNTTCRRRMQQMCRASLRKLVPLRTGAPLQSLHLPVRQLRGSRVATTIRQPNVQQLRQSVCCSCSPQRGALAIAELVP